jgi:hypothetical protein
MKITGIMPLRNAVKLGYPFEVAVRSLRLVCDEVVILADPTSEDDTMAQVRALAPDRIVESAWDMSIRHGVNEIAVQTRKACDAASGDWILSLQADEVIHEGEAHIIREAAERAEGEGATGVELRRLYFYGGLHAIRVDWTLYIARLFKRGRWRPNFDAMSFDPCGDGERCLRSAANIYHYSRVGDPLEIARRVRNLDTLYHPVSEVAAESDVAPYRFDGLRKLDTYVLDHRDETDPSAELEPFPVDNHPSAAKAHFGVSP